MLDLMIRDDEPACAEGVPDLAGVNQVPDQSLRVITEPMDFARWCLKLPSQARQLAPLVNRLLNGDCKRVMRVDHARLLMTTKHSAERHLGWYKEVVHSTSATPIVEVPNAHWCQRYT